MLNKCCFCCQKVTLVNIVMNLNHWTFNVHTRQRTKRPYVTAKGMLNSGIHVVVTYEITGWCMPEGVILKPWFSITSGSGRIWLNLEDWDEVKAVVEHCSETLKNLLRDK